jgi:GNAT superfamily N-acetyltransferase
VTRESAGLPLGWRQRDAEDGRALQRLFETDAEFFESSYGHPPGAEAASAFYAVPDGVELADKLLIGADGPTEDLVAFADLVRDWPGQGEWTLGMLFVAPSHRGTGLAKTLWSQLEQLVRANGGERLRAAPAADQEVALAFLGHRGMTEEGRETRRVGLRDPELIIMTKGLDLPEE